MKLIPPPLTCLVSAASLAKTTTFVLPSNIGKIQPSNFRNSLPLAQGTGFSKITFPPNTQHIQRMALEDEAGTWDVHQEISIWEDFCDFLEDTPFESFMHMVEVDRTDPDNPLLIPAQIVQADVAAIRVFFEKLNIDDVEIGDIDQSLSPMNQAKTIAKAYIESGNKQRMEVIKDKLANIKITKLENPEDETLTTRETHYQIDYNRREKNYSNINIHDNFIYNLCVDAKHHVFLDFLEKKHPDFAISQYTDKKLPEKLLEKLKEWVPRVRAKLVNQTKAMTMDDLFTRFTLGGLVFDSIGYVPKMPDEDSLIELGGIDKGPTVFRMQGLHYASPKKPGVDHCFVALPSTLARSGFCVNQYTELLGLPESNAKKSQTIVMTNTDSENSPFKLLNIVEQRDLFIQIGTATVMDTNHILDGFLADKLNDRYPRLFQDINKNFITKKVCNELIGLLQDNPSIEESWLSITKTESNFIEWNQLQYQFPINKVTDIESFIAIHENRISYLKEKNLASNEILFRAGIDAISHLRAALIPDAIDKPAEETRRGIRGPYMKAVTQLNKVIATKDDIEIEENKIPSILESANIKETFSVKNQKHIETILVRHYIQPPTSMNEAYRGDGVTEKVNYNEVGDMTPQGPATIERVVVYDDKPITLESLCDIFQSGGVDPDQALLLTLDPSEYTAKSQRDAERAVRRIVIAMIDEVVKLNGPT